MHVHPPRYTPYVHHDHTHPHMYARVYKCIYCGCKGHLARFSFDRLNFISFVNKNVWVPYDANPHGLKKKWVPKSLPLVFNVGVGSQKCERIDVLMVNACGARWTY